MSFLVVVHVFACIQSNAGRKKKEERRRRKRVRGRKE
jgi:hypothetical protein